MFHYLCYLLPSEPNNFQFYYIFSPPPKQKSMKPLKYYQKFIILQFIINCLPTFIKFIHCIIYWLVVLYYSKINILIYIYIQQKHHKYIYIYMYIYIYICIYVYVCIYIYIYMLYYIYSVSLLQRKLCKQRSCGLFGQFYTVILANSTTQ